MGSPVIDKTVIFSQSSAASEFNLKMPSTYKFQKTPNSSPISTETGAIASNAFTDDLSGKVLVAGVEIVTAYDEPYASVSWTFIDKPNEGSTINLIDADGTTFTFEIDDSADGVTGSNIAVTEIAENGGAASGTVFDLAAKINAQASLDITATKSGSSTASATFTFSDKPNEGSTITLVDSDGTSVVFEIDDTEDGVSGSNVAVTEIAENGGGLTGTAVDLAAKINAQSSLDIVATNPSSGKVDLVQGTVGTAGNTTITVNDASHWNSVCSVNVPSAFVSGTDDTTITLTQGTRGTEGNTAITFNDTSHWSSMISATTIDTSFAGAGCSVLVQGGDGTNWGDITTLISNVLPSSTGITYTTLDLSKVYVPEIRFILNPENRDIKDTSSGTMNFRLSTPT